MWVACGMRLCMKNIGLALEMGLRRVRSLNKHFYIQQLGEAKLEGAQDMPLK